MVEDIAILRAGLTAEGDMCGVTPVVLLRGVDDLGKPVFLRLSIEQIEVASTIQEREAQRWGQLEELEKATKE